MAHTEPPPEELARNQGRGDRVSRDTNYQYTVNRTTYISDNVSCNELFGFSKALTDSEKYSVRYPLQANVTVHYHPTKPVIGVLETKFDPSAWKQIALLTTITFLCALGFAIGGRPRLA